MVAEKDPIVEGFTSQKKLDFWYMHRIFNKYRIYVDAHTNKLAIIDAI